jgi:hypothetical protein
MFEHHSGNLNSHNGERRIKVVAFGSYHSGKTSLIQAVDPHMHGTDVRNRTGYTTVAFDLGVREHRGLKIHLFGTPGQDRFDVAREVVAYGLHAGLVIVDATRGMTRLERQVLAELRAAGVPFIVVASKMDLPGASLELVRRDAGDAEVVPVSARTGEGIAALLDRIAEIAGRLS